MKDKVVENRKGETKMLPEIQLMMRAEREAEKQCQAHRLVEDKLRFCNLVWNIRQLIKKSNQHIQPTVKHPGQSGLNPYSSELPC